MTDPTPAGVYVGTVDAVATAHDTYNDIPEGVTFNQIGFVGIAGMTPLEESTATMVGA